ncbi:MAG: amidohydrolase family protein [Dehalococcoidia bacterium]
MPRVIDIECDLPTPEAYAFRAEGGGKPVLGSGDTFRRWPPGSDEESGLSAAQRGRGMANYLNIFGPGYADAVGMSREAFGEARRTRPADELYADLRGRLMARAMPLAAFVQMLAAAGVERALVGTAQQPSNEYTAQVVEQFPDRFIGFARISPHDGMGGVRELERLVRERGLRGLAMAPFRERIYANDRRYYPLYAKCAELGIPVRLHTSMPYATDRPYDLGHPKYLDDVASDFPELTIIAGLGGWPWVGDLVALARRYPNLYIDTAAHRPRYFAAPGSGWEMLVQFGNTLLQDKVLVGLSWLTLSQPYETLIGEVLALPLKDVVKEKWLYTNAARILGLS